MDSNVDWKWIALDLKDRLNIAIEALEFMIKPVKGVDEYVTIEDLLKMIEADYKKGKSALFKIRKGLVNDDF